MGLDEHGEVAEDQLSLGDATGALMCFSDTAYQVPQLRDFPVFLPVFGCLDLYK